MAKRPQSDLTPMVLLEDEPVPGHWIDELALEPFARIVAGAAVGTGGPFTIGVFADWGLGKTSLLRQAKSLIEGDEQHADVVTVWFNAWQFEKEEHPIVPLVASIVREVERKRVERSKAPAALLKGWSEMSRTLRAIAYGFSAKAKWKVPGFAELEAGFVAKEMIERDEKLKGRDDPLLERSLYYNAFEALEAIAGREDAKIKTPRPKIVVFVDDLDRCLPDQGFRLLESIKLVLAQRGFIFVLAVDRHVLESYLDKRYRVDFGMTDYAEGGTSYLDKIVQLPLYVPSHRGRFEEYIVRLLERPELSHDPKLVEALRALAPVLALGARHNPRSLVRFINNLIVDRRLFERQRGESLKADDDFYTICAVSRILQQELGLHQYRMLANDDQLCKWLAAAPGKPLSQRLQGPTEAKDLRAEQRQTVLSRLERKELIELLDQEQAGRLWLQADEARQAIDEFLDLERREEPQPEGESATIVEEAIRERLNKPTGEITSEERASITELDVSKRSLRDLSSLARLSGLEQLDLADTQVSDLTPLAKLRKLRMLILVSTQVSDLSPLAVLSALQELVLNSTPVSYLAPLAELHELQTLKLWNCRQVSDLTPLAGLTELRKLDVDGTSVSDLSPLEVLSRLLALDLARSRVADLAPLAGLTELRSLRVRTTQVSDLTPLARLTGLRELDLGVTSISNIAPLANLSGLQKLYLEGTQVSDLSPLTGLSELQRLDIRGTKVTDVSPLKHITGLRIEGP